MSKGFCDVSCVMHLLFRVNQKLLRAPTLTFLFLIATLALPLTIARADVFEGKIVSISDGDTLVLLDTYNRQHKIRLHGIDAPEKGQPFGDASRKALSDLVFGKRVVAECNKRDRYKREVCKILIDGMDANLVQIRNGYAWHYKKYKMEQPVPERSLYSEAEIFARSNKIGLWSINNPQPPWDFRLAENAFQKSFSRAGSSKGLFLIPQSSSMPVKLSKNAICHAPGTSVYASIVKYKSYPTLDACLQAGGRLQRP